MQAPVLVSATKKKNSEKQILQGSSTLTIELGSIDRVEIRGRMRQRKLILDVGMHLLMERP